VKDNPQMILNFEDNQAHSKRNEIKAGKFAFQLKLGQKVKIIRDMKYINLMMC